ARSRIGRGEQAEAPAPLVEAVEEELEVARQALAFGAQGGHARGGEDVEAGPMGSEAEDLSIAQLPASCPRHGLEALAHEEALALVVAPPARQAGQLGIAAVALVHEQAA
ncbi:hypothetical protein RZS08_64385, partial [Arthrospira platensis SPKY1]|nr:hypothetical protein [Arthrospira platensis SPKY1]